MKAMDMMALEVRVVRILGSWLRSNRSHTCRGNGSGGGSESGHGKRMARGKEEGAYRRVRVGVEWEWKKENEGKWWRMGARPRQCERGPSGEREWEWENWSELMTGLGWRWGLH